MKHPEMDPDEAIDRVLIGLCEVEPLQGMQERVLRAAKERAGVRRRWTFRLPRAASHSWMATAAAIAVIALAASWKIATIARNHRPVTGIAHAPAHLPPANAPLTETHLASAQIAGPPPARETRLASATEHDTPLEPVSDEDALAISEMLAPSHLAPPMPLTEQERLLIRLIHKGDPVEMAMLDPGFRSLEETKSKAEFDRFFAPKQTNASKPTTTVDQPVAGDSPATLNQPASGGKSDPKKQ